MEHSISAIVVHPKGITKPLPTILQFTIYTGAITDITRDDVAHGYVGYDCLYTWKTV